MRLLNVYISLCWRTRAACVIPITITTDGSDLWSARKVKPSRFTILFLNRRYTKQKTGTHAARVRQLTEARSKQKSPSTY